MELEDVHEVTLASLELALIASTESLEHPAADVHEVVNFVIFRRVAPGEYVLNESELRKRYLSLEFVNSECYIFQLNSDNTISLQTDIPNPILESESSIKRTIEPILSSQGMLLRSADYCSDSPTPYCGLHVSFPGHWNVARAIDTVRVISRMLRHREWQPNSALGMKAVISAGRADLLIGLPETEWLDVKRIGYELQYKDKDAYELACDIASFANSPTGGLIVIGLESTKTRGKDVISTVTPCGPQTLSVQRYFSIAKEKVIPPVEGLEIDTHEYDPGELMTIFIPPQPEEIRPFLVRGALVGGKVKGSFFSMPQRRGDSKWDSSPEAVHSLLVAARAILRVSGQGRQGP